MIPTSCPRCESEQQFVPKLRKDNGHCWLEEYVRCSICHYEQITRYTTPEIELLTTRIRQYADKAQHQMERHGAMTGTLSIKMRDLRKRKSASMTDLYARVREAHGAAAHQNPA